MLDLDQAIFRARALGQSHPYTARAYRYVNDVVARERAKQPSDELGVWAGYAINAGYCMRRVEEEDTGLTVESPPDDLPSDLDAAATHVTTLVRTEGAGPYLLYEEARVVEALDRLIDGEIDRRIGDTGDPEQDAPVDPDVRADVEEYLAWWVVKGYALRVVEFLVPEAAEAEPG